MSVLENFFISQLIYEAYYFIVVSLGPRRITIHESLALWCMSLINYLNKGFFFVFLNTTARIPYNVTETIFI